MTDKTQPDSGRATGGIVEMLHARIAELEARVQELGAMARENRSRRIVELEAQLEAVGAADAVLFIKGRPHFHHPSGERAAFNSGAPICLIAYGKHNADVLRASGLGHVVNSKDPS